ncbi:AAA family ATPase [Leptospira idonii]|uniref:MoxR family ATPase n=1 Tax=Leptospira idonii TaxID=1193500 RepID=A0A4R9M1K6_9LEPT|nr:MoxR family ATPase [Leptospira idonii]TGN19715.1 MoxR family ATPase [Leptospira idonii]
MSISEQILNETSSKIQEIKNELSLEISGMDSVIQPLLVAMVAKGHVLLEGMPGLAKTLLAKSLANCIDAKFSRVQFTPDLLPADLTGTNIFNPKTSSFEVRKGPIFTNILLADEINRAPAKVQSALLQCMEEKQVTIADNTFDLDAPFFVIATQNPIDQDGTYPLPEAQLDRFLFKVNVGYPNEAEELSILNLHGTLTTKTKKHSKVIKPKDIAKIAEHADDVFIDPKLQRFIVQLVRNTRPESMTAKDISSYVKHGASPRASLALLKIAKINALFEARDFVIPEDILKYFSETIRHRILLSLEAITEEVSIDSVIKRILSSTEVP